MDIPIRKLAFDFPEVDVSAVVGEGEADAMRLAFSLLLPHLEPYLIRTMNAAKPQLDDPTLLEDVRRFGAQEGNHFRAHRAFNEQVRLAGFDELARFESELHADYERFTQRKSLRFNLAYAEGFEAMTTTMALLSLDTDDVATDSPFNDLFRWHLVEELEHRTVTFDVYEHVIGNYPYRLAVGTWAQYHFLSWVFRVAGYITRTQRTRQAAAGHPTSKAAAAELRNAQLRYLGTVLRRTARTYLPTYTPHRIEFTPEMRAIADHYSAVAVSVR